MKPVDDKQRSLFCQFESDASLSFFDESHIAHHPTELFRPFIIDNSASQRLEASAVSTGKDYTPFMFAFHGDRLTGAGTVNHLS
jgi:hypothetical protein